MLNRAVRFCALGLLLVLVAAALSPDALACLRYQKDTTYYAWAPTANPNPGPQDVCCGGPCIISPPQPYDRRAVGGKTVYCEGSITTWGFNPMCGDSETIATACPACSP